MFFRKNKKQKIFCIGLGKTGTTSIQKFYTEHGLETGDQNAGERLLHTYLKRDFSPIISLCHTAEAFQDVPFSLPFTFQTLDQTFPNAKFILTVRNSATEWYESLVRFHSKRLTDGKRVPAKEDLKNDNYSYPGFNWEATKFVYNIPDEDPYNQEILTSFYRRHNQNVEDYFRYRDNFIKINVANDADYARLCSFLELKSTADKFPWENKSK